MLLEAMKGIAQKAPGAKLVIAGNGDITPYQTMIQECANNLDLHIGWIEDNQVERFLKRLILWFFLTHMPLNQESFL